MLECLSRVLEYCMNGSRHLFKYGIICIYLLQTVLLGEIYVHGTKFVEPIRICHEYNFQIDRRGKIQHLMVRIVNVRK